MDYEILSILIASDLHLGFMEKDPVRGEDTLNTLEEILNIALEKKVDMILLGGDVFHDNKPSRRILFKTMELLRKYCLGEIPCYLDVVSDPNTNFPTNNFGTVNYEDPNYNISLPVFSIHGNHDDPSGDGNLCALDLLSVNGLVNYFGRVDDISDIKISPILIKKENTKLALYGLGNIKDERLYRTFNDQKVEFLRPDESKNDWFNLFVLHQNRVNRGPKNYIPESFLSNFFDLIVWGHEHDCLIDPEYKELGHFYITQPGSTVATSLSEGESLPKHIGLLNIKGKKFKLEKIPLKSTRLFVAKDVEYSGGFNPFNIARFGQLFTNRVANPSDILLFYKKKIVQETEQKRTTKEERRKFQEVLENLSIMNSNDSLKIEDILKETIRESKYQLELLTENKLIEAVKMFVQKDETDSIKKNVEWSLKSIERQFIDKIEVTQNGQLVSIDNSIPISISKHFTTLIGSRSSLSDESKEIEEDDSVNTSTLFENNERWEDSTYSKVKKPEKTKKKENLSDLKRKKLKNRTSFSLQAKQDSSFEDKKNEINIFKENKNNRKLPYFGD